MASLASFNISNANTALLYAVTQKTAAELITARANPADPHFGLLHWKSAQVRKQDIMVAKHYLTEDEIDTLNRLEVIFLETAELRTKRCEEIRMAFWRQNVDRIIGSNGFPVLTHAGTISMRRAPPTLYLDFDQCRKQEAAQADQLDEAELKTHGPPAGRRVAARAVGGVPLHRNRIV